MFQQQFGRWKRANVEGRDVFIRPEAQDDGRFPAVAMVDDLDASAVKRMAADGFKPSAVVETSPGNLQAWVRLADEPVDGPVLERARAQLAEDYGGDGHAARRPDQAGRPPGMTNQKPKHAGERGAPFAKLRHAGRVVARRGRELVEQVRQALRSEAQAEHRADVVKTQFAGDSGDLDTAVATFTRAKKRIARSTSDESRQDFRAAMDLARGGYDVDQIAAAIVQARPNLREKHHDPQDYADRTARKAAAAVEPPHEPEVRPSPGRGRGRDPGPM
jgi:hypothetical protein